MFLSDGFIGADVKDFTHRLHDVPAGDGADGDEDLIPGAQGDAITILVGDGHLAGEQVGGLVLGVSGIKNAGCDLPNATAAATIRGLS